MPAGTDEDVTFCFAASFLISALDVSILDNTLASERHDALPYFPLPSSFFFSLNLKPNAGYLQAWARFDN